MPASEACGDEDGDDSPTVGSSLIRRLIAVGCRRGDNEPLPVGEDPAATLGSSTPLDVRGSPSAPSESELRKLCLIGEGGCLTPEWLEVRGGLVTL